MVTKNLQDARQAWNVVEKEIMTKETNACKEKLMDTFINQQQQEKNVQQKPTSPSGSLQNEIKMKDFAVTRIVYTGTRYRVVYIPIYVISYLSAHAVANSEDSKANAGNKYTCFINAQTSALNGQRPWGMGQVFGGGLRLLEGLLGVKDAEGVSIVTGKMLGVTDAVGYYERNASYLIFPPSHSYILTYDIGYIILKNNSRTEAVELVAQKRESDKIGGRYLLQPGTTETFPYKGNWCIKISTQKSMQENGKKVSVNNKEKEQNNNNNCYSGQPIQQLSENDGLSVVEISADNGRDFEDKLGMIN